MSTKLPLNEAVEELNKLKKEIADVGDKFPRIMNNIGPYLRKQRESGQYLEYIVFGASLIEFMLSKIFAMLSHYDSQSSIWKNDLLEGERVELLTEVEIKMITKDGSDPLGALIRDLKTYFKFDERYPDLYKDLIILKNTRNDAVHHMIEKYEGDMDRVNNDIKLYAEKQPIEFNLQSILKIQNDIVTLQEETLRKFYLKYPKPPMVG